jgi:hypothetical protein
MGLFLVNRHGSTRSGISAVASCAVLNGESTESAEFDTILLRQSGDDLIEDGVDKFLDVSLVQEGSERQCAAPAQI